MDALLHWILLQQRAGSRGLYPTPIGPHIIMWILKVHFVCVFVIVTWWFCKTLLKYGTCCNGMHVSPCPSNAIWIYQITHLRDILEGSRIPTSPLNYVKGIVEFAPPWSVVLGKVMYAPCGVICECVWSVAFWATPVVHEMHCGRMIIQPQILMTMIL